MLFRGSRIVFGQINKVGILGGGIMGSGIAAVVCAAGKQAVLLDINQEALASSQKSFAKALAWVDKKPMAFMKNGLSLEQATSALKLTLDVKEAVEGCDLVVEAVPENLGLKQKIFADCEAASSSKTILATNTSSLSVTTIGEKLSRQGTYAGLHFFSPVHRMGLIEVIRTEKTSQDTIDSLVTFCKEIGKSPVVCKDTPGFAVNRLLVPLMMEACRMVERGDVSMEDVDTAMRLGAGHPMGPFRLCDMVGLDTMKHIVDGWHAADPTNPLWKPSPLIDERVAAGKLGAKTGEGFFKW